jgi:hypothetical protein
MDVWASPYPQTDEFKILADDFLCTSTDPILDVHIWGSWLNDLLPRTPTGAPDPARVRFKLSIHDDIPVGPNNDFSRPGTLRYSRVFEPGDFTARLFTTNTGFQELFFDPNAGTIVGSDTQVWQYNFTNFPDPFVQEGTPTAPRIYWLDVQAQPLDELGEAVFGWKTSLQHFQDDAVFGDTLSFGDNSTTINWRELRYPTSHPLAGQSIDLAFVITPEPSNMGLAVLGLVILGWFRSLYR